MDASTVAPLYPPGGEPRELQGLYLTHDLRRRAPGARPYVYSNFIASLDGRISEPVPGSRRRRVPAALANPRDWRLYMELLAQCDAVLTTARHLRAIAAGRQRELLDLGGDAYGDLADWRRQRGLPPQPLTVVISAALDIPAQLQLPGGLLVVTAAEASEERVRALRTAGIEVLRCGEGARVDTDALLGALPGRGVGLLYSIAGPRVLHGLLQAGAVDRLYLTLALTLLGGETFDTLTFGPALAPPPGFRLHELYLDEHAPAGAGQLLLSVDRREDAALTG